MEIVNKERIKTYTFLKESLKPLCQCQLPYQETYLYLLTYSSYSCKSWNSSHFLKNVTGIKVKYKNNILKEARIWVYWFSKLGKYTPILITRLSFPKVYLIICLSSGPYVIKELYDHTSLVYSNSYLLLEILSIY